MAQSRVLYAMSRDGYLPKSLSKIHSRFCTPHFAVIVGSIFTLIFAASGFVNFVVYAVNLGFIIGFSIVNLSLIKLRKIAPNLKRPFKTPLYPIMPIAGLVTSAFLILFIEPSVLILGFELGIVALFIYYIRMIGQNRLRIAFGGISLGLGGLTVYVAYAIQNHQIVLSGFSSGIVNQIYYLLLFIALIQFIAGILNLSSNSA
jgi:amino acid transporter